MPIYPFRCEECSGEFDVFASFEKATTEKWPCEHCGSADTKKVPALLTYHIGLTAAEKSAGVKKSRRDAGNYMRDARDKRKKEFGPNSREGQSNELWTGGEYDKQVFKGPSKK